jgi:DNA-directed RNA polymerase specialized sigma24 family protein
MTEEQKKEQEFIEAYKFIENIVRNEHRKNVNLFLHQAYDVQDLIQECWLKVLVVLEKESKRTDIRDMKRFVNRSVKNKLMDMLDHIHFVIKHEVVKTEFSDSCDTGLELNDDYNSGGEDNPDHYLAEFNLEMSDILFEIKKILTPQEYAIVIARYNGLTFKEITKHLSTESWGKSEPIIMEYYKVAKEKIKDFFSNEGVEEYGTFISNRNSHAPKARSCFSSEAMNTSGIQEVKRDIELEIERKRLENEDLIDALKAVLNPEEHFIVAKKLRGYKMKEIIGDINFWNRPISIQRASQIYCQAKKKVISFIEAEGLLKYAKLFKKDNK